MTVTASVVFDFIGHNDTCMVERHEIALADFGLLRRNLRSIILNLYESDDIEARDAADKFRTFLSEWLTVPIPFDDAITNALRFFGAPESVERRWGRDIRAFYEAAVGAAEKLRQQPNPMRLKLVGCLRQLQVQRQSFRIYCHRWAVSHFESLLDQAADTPLGEGSFLHSVRDYRESEPFDVLIKVGPLRARGWGSAPDALLSAPRFATLVQIVWSGCGDEPGFGEDPVANYVREPDATSLSSNISRISRISFSDAECSEDGSDEDEFQLFRAVNSDREKRKAILLQIDGEHGILYPRHSQVLSFDPSLHEEEPIRRRLPGETLVEGMFVMMPRLEGVDLGGFQAEHGHYFRIWKARLSEEHRRDPVGLIERLRNAGLDLVNLHSAIHHWCKPPTTVIHAPQQRRHFEILIRVLGIDFGSSDGGQWRLRAPWWQYAWNEIGVTRGEAIQAGVHGQEMIEAQLVSALNTHMNDLRTRALAGVGFLFHLTGELGLQGLVLFNKVHSIEEGFMAPDTRVKYVCELSEIEQWRV